MNDSEKFSINGRELNHCGLTVGFNYNLTATSVKNAVDKARRQATENGIRHVQIVYVISLHR